MKTPATYRAAAVRERFDPPVGHGLLYRMALCVCLLSALPLAQGATPINIVMKADHWQTKENAEFLQQLGFFHGLMRLNSGNAVLKDVTFGNGTIEFDVNTVGRGMPGIGYPWTHSSQVALGQRGGMECHRC